MENFDLKKYLSENKLLKENITKAYIQSHEDYHDLYLTNREALNQLLADYKEDGDNWEPEYIIDLDPGMYQMIFWNDEGPNSMSFDSKLDYVKEAIASFWGEDQFIKKFGIEDEIDAAGDNWGDVFDKHVEDNLDMYFEELNKYIEDSYPDKDSYSGVVLLLNGKIKAGEATEI